MLEPLRRDDIMVIVSLPLGAVAALDEELAQPVAGEVGSKNNAVRFARRGACHFQGALLLGCMRGLIV